MVGDRSGGVVVEGGGCAVEHEATAAGTIELVVEPERSDSQGIGDILDWRELSRAGEEDIGGVAGNGFAVVDPITGQTPIVGRGGVGPGEGLGQNRRTDE